MNRNQLYDYLTSLGLFPLFIWRDKKSYHVEFRNNADSDEKIGAIVTDWGYITGVDSIHLFTNELAVTCGYEMGQINMYYSKLDKFEVRMEEIE